MNITKTCFMLKTNSEICCWDVGANKSVCGKIKERMSVMCGKGGEFNPRGTRAQRLINYLL